MPNEERSIDLAMAAERPAKKTVRALWVPEVRKRKFLTAREIPFYLTLAGAKGLDLQTLIEAGVIETTETMAIKEGDNRRVIAVERDDRSVLELQRNFAGLAIRTGDIFEILQGISPIAFPTGETRRVCRASVVNLDFNIALQYRSGTFRVLEAVVKLGSLHVMQPPVPWTLFLTVNSNINWEEAVSASVQVMVIEQCRANPMLESGCMKLLGQDIYKELEEGNYVNLADLTPDGQQAFLMIFVPVWLALKINPQGWQLRVVKNMRYGGEPGVAPIVSWIMEFEPDERVGGTPQARMRESLESVVSECYEIDADGEAARLLIDLITPTN